MVESRMKPFIFGLAVVVGLVLLSPLPSAQEVQTLTSPLTFANVTGCKLIRFAVIPNTDDITKAVITVEMAGTGSAIGQSFNVTWDSTTSPTGQTLTNQLNKANFSAANDSLLKQIFTKTG